MSVKMDELIADKLLPLSSKSSIGTRDNPWGGLYGNFTVFLFPDDIQADLNEYWSESKIYTGDPNNFLGYTNGPSDHTPEAGDTLIVLPRYGNALKQILLSSKGIYYRYGNYRGTWGSWEKLCFEGDNVIQLPYDAYAAYMALTDTFTLKEVSSGEISMATGLVVIFHEGGTSCALVSFNNSGGIEIFEYWNHTGMTLEGGIVYSDDYSQGTFSLLVPSQARGYVVILQEGNGEISFRDPYVLGYYGDEINNYLPGETVTALTSVNYNNWAPSLTGEGASGSWNINISGTASSAAYASIAATASGINVSPLISTQTDSTQGYKLALIPKVSGNAQSVYANSNFIVYSGAQESLAWLSVPELEVNKTRLTTATVSIAGNKVPILNGSLTANTLRTSLGLSNALHFIGTTTTPITDGSTTVPTDITGYTMPSVGDVVLYNGYEFVWTDSKCWEMLGPDSSYKLLQELVTDPEVSEVGCNSFISNIEQDKNGNITATKKEIASLTLKNRFNETSTYNGSSEINFSAAERRCVIGIDDTDSAGWYKVAEIEIKGPTVDREIVFKVSTGFSTAIHSGILRAHVRTSNAGEIADNATQLWWEYANSGININDFILAYTNDTDNGKATATLYVYCGSRWRFYHFNVLQEHDRRLTWKKMWQLYSTEVSGETMPDDNLPSTMLDNIDSLTYITSTLLDINNAVKQIYINSSDLSNAIYYPTWVKAGSSNQTLNAHGGFGYEISAGTDNETGITRLRLGRYSSSDVTKQQRGTLRLYEGNTEYYHTIRPDGAHSGNRASILRDYGQNGYLVATPTSAEVGSSTQPVYINDKGLVTACSTSLTDYLPVTGGTVTGETVFENGIRVSGGSATFTGGITVSGGITPNDESLSIVGNLVPSGTNTYNLGSTTKKWANVYATTFAGTNFQGTNFWGSNFYGTASSANKLTGTYDANTVLAAPADASGASSFRKLVAADLPVASSTESGIVTTGTQTFAGEKTFNSDIIKITHGRPAGKWSSDNSASILQIGDYNGELPGRLKLYETNGNYIQLIPGTVNSGGSTINLTLPGTTQTLIGTKGSSAIEGPLTPISTNTYNIGSINQRWNYIYGTNINGTNIICDNIYNENIYVHGVLTFNSTDGSSYGSEEQRLALVPSTGQIFFQLIE